MHTEFRTHLRDGRSAPMRTRVCIRLISRALIVMLLWPALLYAQPPPAKGPAPGGPNDQLRQPLGGGDQPITGHGRSAESGMQGMQGMMGGQEMMGGGRGGMMGSMPMCMCPASALHGPLGIVAGFAGSVLVLATIAVLIALTIFLMRRSRQIPAS